MHFELTREYISDLKDVIARQDEVVAAKMLSELHAADIAEIYGELDIEEAKYLYMLLDQETAADLLVELDEDDRERFIKALSPEVIARKFIDNMDSDDAADVLNELSPEMQERILHHMKDKEQAGDIIDLLNYDEDTAGGLMAKELISVNINWNILTCLKEMRKQAEDVDEVYFVYAVDDNNILKGTVSLKKMLLSPNNAKIKNIYNPDLISVRVDTPSTEVANIMGKYGLVVLPVVDAIGRLVGRITIDDVVDVIREEAEKDYQMISGISDDVEASDNVFILTRARLPWLLVGLAGGILGSRVIGNYEDQLHIYPEMAFFIPLIGAMGGNVGVQSSAIIVQGLANNTLGIDSYARKMTKDLTVALLNGVCLSGLLFVYNLVVSDSFALTISVSAALFSVIIFASMFGTVVPLALDKIKIDPALATGPFITTTNDIMGMFIYFSIGRLFYGIV